ncbi:DUF2894 domain-containing protein [Variovorax sp. J22G21]|uniref:DUF2894 domain-containing protein n=1 Tax=Variovorax fucosicus TaxID=3053517 RepID=UPI002578ABCC|nr:MULTISPECIES: DUF2894 domain-containing protein [unclassified Variovorax]MDM0038589.1 DUF2894 domain-containing protein [Variovorax sp. J22R193]MDM0063365.1 DUF2894 domain-containing protein [Variovorax sp. J22G21]
MSSTDAGALLDAWRERGDHHHDPVRFRFIEALATRAAAQRGDARRILDDRLARLLAAYGEELGTTDSCADATAKLPTPPDRSALAELVDHIGRHASTHDVETLSYFRSTWSRLSAERRLTQSLAKLPENAGPLNSHQLVHRSLTLMRELSPEYLHRFMAYVDALLWIDQANAGGAPAGADVPRGESHRKTARARSTTAP